LVKNFRVQYLFLAFVTAAALLAAPFAVSAAEEPKTAAPDQKTVSEKKPEQVKKTKKTKKAKKVKKAEVKENSAVVEVPLTSEVAVIKETPAVKDGQTKETGAACIFTLMEKKQATVEDLLDVLLIFKNKSPEGLAVDDKVKFLKDAKIVPERTQIYPKDLLRKGFAAMLFHRALGLRGGLIIRMAGTSTRNCLRELIYQGVMSEASERDKMSGPELLSVIYKAKQYQSDNNKSL